jgi:hypothetical protein
MNLECKSIPWGEKICGEAIGALAMDLEILLNSK